MVVVVVVAAAAGSLRVIVGLIYGTTFLIFEARAEGATADEVICYCYCYGAYCSFFLLEFFSKAATISLTFERWSTGSQVESSTDQSKIDKKNLLGNTTTTTPPKWGEREVGGKQANDK